MEIYVHILKDLNRYLNLGLYLLVDADRILVNSLTTGKNLLEFNSSQTMDLYIALMDLRKKINSWVIHSNSDRTNVASTIRGQIYTNFKFDINLHYSPKKYGKF